MINLPNVPPESHGNVAASCSAIGALFMGLHLGLQPAAA
jgi:hypothetical protein